MATLAIVLYTLVLLYVIPGVAAVVTQHSEDTYNLKYRPWSEYLWIACTWPKHLRSR